MNLERQGGTRITVLKYICNSSAPCSPLPSPIHTELNIQAIYPGAVISFWFHVVLIEKGKRQQQGTAWSLKLSSSEQFDSFRW